MQQTESYKVAAMTFVKEFAVILAKCDAELLTQQGQGAHEAASSIDSSSSSSNTPMPGVPRSADSDNQRGAEAFR
jgi:hypothetical protein